VTVWEAVIKVSPTDTPTNRARDISAGIGYACSLLMDEYGWTPKDIERRLDAIVDDAYDQQEQRRNGR
jgi:hypothetical protein